MDYDKILVLDKGEISQYDSPENLLKDEDGIFYGFGFMVKSLLCWKKYTILVRI